MSDRKLGKVAKTLIRAKKLIEDEGNWCQNAYSKRAVDGDPNSKFQYCILGAIYYTDLRGHGPTKDFINEVCKEVHHKYVCEFNDENKRTHSEVMQLLDTAIGRAINNPYVGYEQMDFFNEE